eukprot:5116377-Amphidinium_carterae.1
MAILTTKTRVVVCEQARQTLLSCCMQPQLPWMPCNLLVSTRAGASTCMLKGGHVGKCAYLA